MARLSILFVFLFILFNYQEASSIYRSTLDDIEDPRYPSHASSSLLNLWYNQLNNLEDNEQQENFEHVLKRFSPDSTQLRQRRRFGNTRYGRSLPTNN